MMKQKGFLVILVLFAFAMVLGCPALGEVAAPAEDAPIQVVSSGIERIEEGILCTVPLEGAMMFKHNRYTDSSCQMNYAGDNMMYYTLTYTIAEPGEYTAKLVLTGPDGAVERVNALPFGEVEGENLFDAVILAASGAKGEYVAELYLNDVLCDTLTFAD